jgi:hypothetical protein
LDFEGRPFPGFSGGRRFLILSQFLFFRHALGTIFVLANKFQIIGDSIIPDITFKQWFLLLMMFKEEQLEYSVNEIDVLISSSKNTKKW